VLVSVDRLLFRRKLHRSNVLAVTFSPDGDLLASSSGGVILPRSIEKPEEVARDFEYREGRDFSLALAPDGITVATTDVRNSEEFGGDTLRLYDVETGDPVLTLELADDRADVLAFSPDGTEPNTQQPPREVQVYTPDVCMTY
jgi:WD40 repeat protein